MYGFKPKLSFVDYMFLLFMVFFMVCCLGMGYYSYKAATLNKPEYYIHVSGMPNL